MKSKLRLTGTSFSTFVLILFSTLHAENYAAAANDESVNSHTNHTNRSGHKNRAWPDRPPPLYPTSPLRFGGSSNSVGGHQTRNYFNTDWTSGGRGVKAKRFVNTNEKPSRNSNNFDSPVNPLQYQHDRTTKSRWWLDALVRLLHEHPLHLSKYVRQISIPASKLGNADPSTPHFPKQISEGELAKSVPMYDQIWAVQKLRFLLSSYRDWLSPRQWHEFLHKDEVVAQSDTDPDVNLELLEAAVAGVRGAVAECRYQFRNERWNCSQLSTDGSALFGNVLIKGIPETAFVYSIVSAGLVRAVAEACLSNIRNCPCNNRGRSEPEAGWQWQGCDHNIHFGRRFTRRLLDQMEDGFHIRFLMNLHNNRVGRRIVAQNMERYCRCHGTSGSCTLKTCYRQTPSIRKIGNQLKLMYQTASQVIRDNTIPDTWGRSTISSQNGFSSVIQLNRWNPRTLRDVSSDKRSSLRYNFGTLRGDRKLTRPSLIKVDTSTVIGGLPVLPRGLRGGDLRPTTEELVYFERTDRDLFCEAKPALHIMGTRGRECNSTSSAPNNCRTLCCQRGYHTQHYYSLQNCECKFVWCCRVECRKCLILKKQETCL